MSRLCVGLVLAMGWVLCTSSPAAADVTDLSVTVDRGGVAHVTATTSCTAGDDVEIDVFLVQNVRGEVTEAHADLFGVCPAGDQITLSGGTWESDPLKAGRASYFLSEVHYCAEFDFSPCVDEAGEGQVTLRPHWA